jgi:hypothetical protein
MVSIKNQRRYIVRIKKMLTKITEAQRKGEHLVLDTAEIETVERALLCHRAVITQDLERRAKDGH